MERLVDVLSKDVVRQKGRVMVNFGGDYIMIVPNSNEAISAKVLFSPVKTWTSNENYIVVEMEEELWLY